MGNWTMWLITAAFWSHWSEISRSESGNSEPQCESHCNTITAAVRWVILFLWCSSLSGSTIYRHTNTHTHTHTQTWVLPNNCRAAGTLWQRRSIKKTKKYQSFIFQTVSTLPAKCSSLYKCSTERAFTFLSAAVLSEQVLCCYTGGCLTEIKAATRRASEGRPSRETETTSASWNKIIRSTFFFITDVRVKVPKRGKKHWMHVITSHP